MAAERDAPTAVRGDAARQALLRRIRELLRDVPGFPRAGILFRDITPILSDPDALRGVVEAIADDHREDGVEVVVGIESRGFVLGGAIALLLGAGFVPVRKKGKLPYRTIAAAYQLEYGEAVLEMHADAVRPGQHVLIVDDLLATGGTARAAADLVERCGGLVVGLAFLIEIADLGGAAALGDLPRRSLLRL
jgi:adenine phosphoribosyltransferase